MYEELYTQNKGLLYTIAGRYYGACKRDRAVDVDDLVQAGFLGLIRAQESYDPDAGKTWASWAVWYILTEIRNTLGLRDGKPTRAHTGALELDQPVSGADPDGDTLIATLADESLPEALENLERADTARAVRKAVDALEGLQRDAMVLWALRGMTKQCAARALGVSEKDCKTAIQAGVRKLRRNYHLRKLADLDGLTRFHAYKGLNAFLSTGSSVVEDAVLWRIDQRARWGDLDVKAEHERPCSP